MSMSELATTQLLHDAGQMVRQRDTYPSPFYDQARNYMPTNIKSMFDHFLYYAMTHPLISAILYKLAIYGVTDLVYDTDRMDLRKLYENLEESLRMRAFQTGSMLDTQTFGISFSSVEYPFRKMLRCRKCHVARPASEVNYRFRSMKFHLMCRCGHHGDAEAYDLHYVAPAGIDLIRWNPKYIDLVPTGRQNRFRKRLTLSEQITNGLRLGLSEIVETVRQQDIDALRENRPIYIREERVSTIRREGPSHKDSGWGLSLLLPVLKSAFYLQILQRSQEALAHEHLVPLRVLFPQATSGDARLGAPHMPSGTDLVEWQQAVRQEILQWKRDQNHIPIMPLPLGSQTIGGDGRSLSLHQEIRVWADWICAAMMIPSEFVFGGVSWSGSTVSMRFVQNVIKTLRMDGQEQVNWIYRQLAPKLGWPIVGSHYKPFTAMDDMQRRQTDIQMAMQGKLSWATVHRDAERDPMAEFEQILRETERDNAVMREQQLASARVQTEVMMIQAAAQQIINQAYPPNTAAQEAQVPQMMGPGDVAQEGEAPPSPHQSAYQQVQSPLSASGMASGLSDMRTQAVTHARTLRGMNESHRASELARIRATNPIMHSLLMNYLYVGGDDNQSQKIMQPLPEQLPPRRYDDVA